MLLFRSNAYTEKWNLTDADNPSRIGIMQPGPKSRDYQFGIALFPVDNNPPYCPKGWNAIHEIYDYMYRKYFG